MDGKGAEADRAIPGEKITPERPVKDQYVTEITTGQYVMDYDISGDLLMHGGELSFHPQFPPLASSCDGSLQRLAGRAVQTTLDPNALTLGSDSFEVSLCARSTSSLPGDSSSISPASGSHSGNLYETRSRWHLDEHCHRPRSTSAGSTGGVFVRQERNL